jgi:hypothetical protein
LKQFKGQQKWGQADRRRPRRDRGQAHRSPAVCSSASWLAKDEAEKEYHTWLKNVNWLVSVGVVDRLPSYAVAE